MTSARTGWEPTTASPRARARDGGRGRSGTVSGSSSRAAASQEAPLSFARLDGLHLKLRKTGAGRYALGVDFELSGDGAKLEGAKPQAEEAPEPEESSAGLMQASADDGEDSLGLAEEEGALFADDGEEGLAIEDEGDEEGELATFAGESEPSEGAEEPRWPNRLPVPDGVLEISQAPALFDEAAGDEEEEEGVSAEEADPALQAVEKMLAEARKSIGLGESPPGSNHNKITVWYNKNIAKIGNGPWCNMAVTYWAGCSSNLPAILAGKNIGYAYTVAHAQKFKKKGLWHTGVAGIKAGDVVFFDWKGSHSIANVDHVGIVEKVQGKKIVTIEGNTTGNKCKRVVRDAKFIVGYGRPAYGQ